MLRPSVDRAEQDRLRSLSVEDLSLYLNVKQGIPFEYCSNFEGTAPDMKQQQGL